MILEKSFAEMFFFGEIESGFNDNLIFKKNLRRKRQYLKYCFAKLNPYRNAIN